MSDPQVWYQWTDTLLASGGEQFMIIGNFLGNSATPDSMLGNASSSAYFIDDISLVLIEDSIISSTAFELSQIKLTSTVVDHHLYYSLPDQFKPRSILVHSVAGNLVRAITPNASNTVDVSGLPAGVFILQVTSANGQTLRTRFVKL